MILYMCIYLDKTDNKSYENVINQYETLAPELLNLMIH